MHEMLVARGAIRMFCPIPLTHIGEYRDLVSDISGTPLLMPLDRGEALIRFSATTWESADAETKALLRPDPYTWPHDTILTFSVALPRKEWSSDGVPLDPADSARVDEDDAAADLLAVFCAWCMR